MEVWGSCWGARWWWWVLVVWQWAARWRRGWGGAGLADRMMDGSPPLIPSPDSALALHAKPLQKHCHHSRSYDDNHVLPDNYGTLSKHHQSPYLKSQPPHTILPQCPAFLMLTKYSCPPQTKDWSKGIWLMTGRLMFSVYLFCYHGLDFQHHGDTMFICIDKHWDILDM